MNFFKILFGKKTQFHNEPDESTETIRKAKEFFEEMGCSHFHMAREYPERYSEYKRLKISKQTEMKWTEEKFDEYYVSITNNTDHNSLWSSYNFMYELFLSLRTGTALVKMLGITQHIRDRVPLKDRIIIAETINGVQFQRESRLGLVYLAYDLKNIPIAKAFIELALHFSTYDEQENRGVERCQNAVKLCNEIKLELEL